MNWLGVRLILPSHLEYPPTLCTLLDPPPFRFVRRKLAEVKNSGVGIVGSRHATPYGRGVSKSFGRELSAQGVTVVSGGAVGIDAAAHRIAVNAGGRTVAVLGCGLDVFYSKENRELFEKVIQSGGTRSWEADVPASDLAEMPLRIDIVVVQPFRHGALAVPCVRREVVNHSHVCLGRGDNGFHVSLVESAYKLLYRLHRVCLGRGENGTGDCNLQGNSESDVAHV